MRIRHHCTEAKSRIRIAEAGGINWRVVAAITGTMIAATAVIGALVALGVIHTGGTLPVTTKQTAGGTSSPPAGGSSNPPAGGSSNPPAGGSNNPPAGGSSNPPAGGSSNPPAGGTGSSGSGPGAQPGTLVLPATNVSLLENMDYTLDGRPIIPMPNDSCSGCIRVGDYAVGQLALQADNGVLAWTGSSQPTFAQCKKLLDAGPAKAVGIAITGYVNAPGAVSPNGWLCARSKSGNYLALQFLGYASGGGPYKFAVTGWKGTTASPG
jgi:hypothetical protein